MLTSADDRANRELHEHPFVHDMRVADANDEISQPLKGKVASSVGVKRCDTVMPRATVGLDDEPIADQQVDTSDPDYGYLRPDV